MSEFFSVMAPALVASLLLTTIYVYFGIHIVRRGVIFVDLALAQIAAMGSTVAFLLGYELDGQGAYVFSLGFAFLGAVIFASTRPREEVVPQEAIIGIVYAVAAAATVLLVEKAPHGAEHIKYLLVGNILWVSWESLGRLALLIGTVALFHFIFRRKFALVSLDPQQARSEGISIPLWDLLFYLSLALIVTTSVQTAGVLLIFSFLIVPAVCGILLGRSFRRSLLVGWLVGTGVSFVGSGLSFVWDLPTGATIICTLGLTLFLVALIRRVIVG
ncbi:MAG: metal ABC transporter permease [Candidatus Binatia bacterium]